MLTILDLFYLSLTIVFLVLAGFVSYAAYQLGRTLKSIRILTEEIEGTTRDIEVLKDELKYGFLGVIRRLIGDQKEVSEIG